jgi:DNA-binding CsgD family transcriptional regulator
MDSGNRSDSVSASQRLRELLGETVLPGDARRPIELSTVWASLLAGKMAVIWTFQTDTRLYLISRPVSVGAKARPLSDKEQRVLIGWLSSGAEKRVAYEIGISQSSVTATLKRSLEKIGIKGTPKQIPAIVVLTALAAPGDQAATAATVTLGGQDHLLISAERSDRNLTSALTAAERDIVRLILDGCSNESIASARGSAPRTIANQLGCVFRKLGVSGRIELLVCLARLQLGQSAA